MALRDEPKIDGRYKYLHSRPESEDRLTASPIPIDTSQVGSTSLKQFILQIDILDIQPTYTTYTVGPSRSASSVTSAKT